MCGLHTQPLRVWAGCGQGSLVCSPSNLMLRTGASLCLVVGIVQLLSRVWLFATSWTVAHQLHCKPRAIFLLSSCHSGLLFTETNTYTFYLGTMWASLGSFLMSIPSKCDSVPWLNTGGWFFFFYKGLVSKSRKGAPWRQAVLTPGKKIWKPSFPGRTVLMCWLTCLLIKFLTHTYLGLASVLRLWSLILQCFGSQFIVFFSS